MPLYAARITNPGPGDLLVVECGCGHAGRLAAQALAAVGAGADDRIADLAPRLRCRECDGRGTAGPIGWAGQLTAHSGRRTP
jgi:hypothetical protein